MKKFEYTVEKHAHDEFSDLVFFCNEKGACSLDHVPHHQMENLTNILNARGRKGSELVQLLFGKDGLMTIWKKEID